MIRKRIGLSQRQNCRISNYTLGLCHGLCLAFFLVSLKTILFPPSQIDLSTLVHHIDEKNVPVKSVKSFNAPKSTSISIRNIEASSQSKSTAVAWCKLSISSMSRASSRHFGHFPHATESLLRCWSYFAQEGLTENCGIDLKGSHLEISPWVRDFITNVMQCQFTNEAHPITHGPKDTVYYPNLYKMNPRFEYIRYLDSPEHAHMLRRRLIKDEDIAKVKGKDKPLQIGMIQRKKTRVIENMEEIRDELMKNMQNIEIDVTTFEDKTLLEQAFYFASKDIIIAAHGAALTNSIFITPKTIVLQLYPTGYFYIFYEPLIEQSGGIALDWHNKTAGNPYVKYKALGDNERNEARDVARFYVPPKDILLRIAYILDEIRPQRKKLNEMFGTTYQI